MKQEKSQNWILSQVTEETPFFSTPLNSVEEYFPLEDIPVAGKDLINLKEELEKMIQSKFLPILQSTIPHRDDKGDIILERVIYFVRYPKINQWYNYKGETPKDPINILSDVTAMDYIKKYPENIRILYLGANNPK